MPDKNERCAKRGHLWKLSSYSSKEIGERCSRCDERREREPTKDEAKKLAAHFKNMIAKRPAIHKTFHAYQRYVGERVGYDRMQAARRFAKKHGENGSIQIVGVDDDHYAGSSVVLITHEGVESVGDFRASRRAPVWHGVSVEFIPQCTGEKAIRFFLYPGHLDDLLDVLKQLKRRMQKYPAVRSEMRASAKWRAARRRKR